MRKPFPMSSHLCKARASGQTNTQSLPRHSGGFEGLGSLMVLALCAFAWFVAQPLTRRCHALYLFT